MFSSFFFKACNQWSTNNISKLYDKILEVDYVKRKHFLTISFMTCIKIDGVISWERLGLVMKTKVPGKVVSEEKGEVSVNNF